MSLNDGLIINGTKIGDYESDEFVSTKDFWLFGVNGSSTTNYYWGKIYETMIYEGDELIYHLIPAMRDDSKEYGFYNKANGIFYTPNSQSGFSGLKIVHSNKFIG